MLSLHYNLLIYNSMQDTYESIEGSSSQFDAVVPTD